MLKCTCIHVHCVCGSESHKKYNSSIFVQAQVVLIASLTNSFPLLRHVSILYSHMLSNIHWILCNYPNLFLHQSYKAINRLELRCSTGWAVTARPKELQRKDIQVMYKVIEATTIDLLQTTNSSRNRWLTVHVTVISEDPLRRVILFTARLVSILQVIRPLSGCCIECFAVTMNWNLFYRCIYMYVYM